MSSILHPSSSQVEELYSSDDDEQLSQEETQQGSSTSSTLFDEFVSELPSPSSSSTSTKSLSLLKPSSAVQYVDSIDNHNNDLSDDDHNDEEGNEDEEEEDEEDQKPSLSLVKFTITKKNGNNITNLTTTYDNNEEDESEKEKSTTKKMNTRLSMKTIPSLLKLNNEQQKQKRKQLASSQSRKQATPTRLQLTSKKQRDIVENFTKKKRRFRPGTVALREIRKQQKSTEDIIPKRALIRLVREVAQDFLIDGNPLRFQKSALAAIHAGTEAFLIELLGGANLHAIESCKTQTLMQKNLLIKFRDYVDSIPNFTLSREFIEKHLPKE